uniref:Phosphatidic acid phosphatase type 2/haloperoxidase domain-containing protein n=1 Tax=Oryza nivara TaxID=4536 RepID=A0A0E0HHS9_ORYNI
MPPPPPATSPAPAAIRLGAPHPYLRTHGTKVARLHLLDWIVLALLVAIDAGLNLIEPFHRFVGEDMMISLRYPLKRNTVPIWAVPVRLHLPPFLDFRKKKTVPDRLLFSVLITAVLTDAIKDGVGRPRPNFFWRCFPDGIPKYNNITRGVICHGDKSVIKEGHKSFPSGHTSWSFAGLGFLSWYLAGKIKAFDRGGHVAKLCIVVLPLLIAAMVGVSRVDDYWHHWQDVFTGGILGLVVASFCYLQFFPPPAGEQGGGEHDLHGPRGWASTEAELTDGGALAAEEGVEVRDAIVEPVNGGWGGGRGKDVAAMVRVCGGGFWPHAYFEHILHPEVENQVQLTATSNHHQGLDMRTNNQSLDSMEEGRRAR